MYALSLNYVFFFSFLGIFSSFLSAHFIDKGFSGSQIAFLFSMVPAISFVSNIFWGRIADLKKIRKALNIYFPLIGSVAFTLALIIDQYYSYILMGITVGIFVNPLFALTDSMTISYCQHKNKSYGKIRQWGTISFGLTNLFIIPFIYFQTDLSIEVNNYTLLFLMPFFLFLRFLSGIKSISIEHTGDTLNTKDLIALFKSPGLLLFFLASMIHGMSFVSNYVYFSPYLKSMGFSLIFIALCWAISPFFEIFVFKYSENILKKFSLGSLFRISLLITGLRWFIISNTSNPTTIFFSQFLHTFGFGVYFITVIKILTIHIPEKVRSSGQTIFMAFSAAIGQILGNLVFGYTTERFPLYFIFQVAGYLSLLAFIASLFIPSSFWKKQNATPNTE
ncbi:MAG: hypothetical protein COA79_17775 [Planctomycetota bacterium]|nr:MAG: hypothetical protein COA79_17775 [Planctomycetota bacterium]